MFQRAGARPRGTVNSILSVESERLTAAGAEDAEGALRKAKNWGLNFKDYKSKPKPQRNLCVLCACGGELASL